MTVTAMTSPAPIPFSTSERDRIIKRLRYLAWLLDTCVRIPGTKFTIGLDPVIGLAPGVGDALMLLASLYIVYEGKRLGASQGTLNRMMINILIDLLVGSIPVLGDVFDAGWKANQRNLALLGIQPLSTSGVTGR